MRVESNPTPTLVVDGVPAIPKSPQTALEQDLGDSSLVLPATPWPDQSAGAAESGKAPNSKRLLPDRGSLALPTLPLFSTAYGAPMSPLVRLDWGRE